LLFRVDEASRLVLEPYDIPGTSLLIQDEARRLVYFNGIKRPRKAGKA
jgi:hypothetical protein